MVLTQPKRDLLHQLYYHPETGFGNFMKLYKHAKLKNNSITIADVKQFLNAQEVKQIHYQAPKPKYFALTSYAPFQRLQMDLMDMSQQTDGGYRYILLIVDVYTRYMIAIPLKTKTLLDISTAFKKVMNEIDSLHMYTVRQIDCDQESAFNSVDFRNLCVQLNIHLNFIHTQDYETTGIVERAIRTLRLLIKKFQASYYSTRKPSWVRYLVLLVKNYNNSYHRTLGTSPVEAFDKRDTYDRNIARQNAKATQYQFQIGDRVRFLQRKKRFQKGDPLYTKRIYTIDRIGNGDGTASSGYIHLQGVHRYFRPWELQKIDAGVAVPPNNLPYQDQPSSPDQPSFTEDDIRLDRNRRQLNRVNAQKAARNLDETTNTRQKDYKPGERVYYYLPNEGWSVDPAVIVNISSNDLYRLGGVPNIWFKFDELSRRAHTESRAARFSSRPKGTHSNRSGRYKYKIGDFVYADQGEHGWSETPYRIVGMTSDGRYELFNGRGESPLVYEESELRHEPPAQQIVRLPTPNTTAQEIRSRTPTQQDQNRINKHRAKALQRHHATYQPVQRQVLQDEKSKKSREYANKHAKKKKQALNPDGTSNITGPFRRFEKLYYYRANQGWSEKPEGVQDLDKEKEQYRLARVGWFPKHHLTRTKPVSLSGTSSVAHQLEAER